MDLKTGSTKRIMSDRHQGEHVWARPGTLPWTLDFILSFRDRPETDQVFHIQLVFCGSPSGLAFYDFGPIECQDTGRLTVFPMHRQPP